MLFTQLHFHILAMMLTLYQGPEHPIPSMNIAGIKGPEMSFEETHHDFGDVMKGEKRAHVFVFTNTGDEDLVIEIGSACDCTTLDWPRRPIPPGEKGEIPIIFDSSSKEGEVVIDIDIIANTDPILNIIQFRANVIESP